MITTGQELDKCNRGLQVIQKGDEEEAIEVVREAFPKEAPGSQTLPTVFIQRGWVVADHL
jgi:hypothetical protein